MHLLGQRPKLRGFGTRATLGLRAVAVSFLAAWLSACAAQAQEFLSPGTAPLSGYEAPGIRSGEFLIQQSVSTGIAYDSNILQSTSRPIQDFIFFVSPVVDITRDGGKNVQELLVSATSTKYFKSSADDYNDVFVKARETYFLSNVSQIDFNASYSDGYQRRMSRNFDIPTNAANPVHELIFLASLGFKQVWRNYEAGVTVTSSAERFDDVMSTSGFLLDQTFRNENDLLLDSFFNYNLTSRIRSNFVFQGFDIAYKDSPRNFREWRAAETVTVDLTSKTSIGVLVALRQQDLYNQPGYNANLLAEYEAKIEWKPTQTISFRAKAGYHDLGVDYVAGVFSGGFAPYYSLDANYLIWRNLNFFNSVNFETRHLTLNSEIDDVWIYKSVLTYELSSYAGVSLLYNYQEWSSQVQSSNFKENIFQTSLNLRF
jgi:hypothetical protein